MYAGGPNQETSVEVLLKVESPLCTRGNEQICITGAW